MSEHPRYFVDRGQGEQEVSREEYMQAELQAGFPPNFPGEPATAMFYSYKPAISGRVAPTDAMTTEEEYDRVLEAQEEERKR